MAAAVPAAVMFGLVGGAAVAAAYLAWRSRRWPLVHDAPLMHYIAWRIADGAVPYRDVFDMNVPGAYLVHVFVIRALGAGDAAWRAFDLAWLAATSIAAAMFAAPWGRSAALGAALVLALHHLASGAWQAGQRDFLLGLPMLLGALGAARWLEGGGRLDPALAGAALGAAATLKPHAALFAAAMAAVVLAHGRRLAPLAAFAAGGAIAPAAAVLWVAARGGLAAWWSIVHDYLIPLYSRLSEPRWHGHRPEVWVALAAAVAITLASALVHRRISARHGVAVLGVGYGVAHYVLQHKGWDYHLYPLAVWTAILTFAEISALLGRRAWPWALPLAACIAASLLGLTVKGLESAWAAEHGWVAAKRDRVDAVARALAGRVGSTETVQVFDTAEGGIHALLRIGARQPTRFIYDFHFFHDIDTPTVRALRRELMTALTRRPPRFIVLFEHGWPRSGYDRLDTFPALRDYVASSYRVDVRGDGFTIYAKRDDP